MDLEPQFQAASILPLDKQSVLINTKWSRIIRNRTLEKLTHDEFKTCSMAFRSDRSRLMHIRQVGKYSG